MTTVIVNVITVTIITIIITAGAEGLVLTQLAMQVHCKICKRNGSDDDSLVQRLKTGTQFTHHQKSVILDAAGLEGGPQVDQDLDSGRVLAPALPPFPPPRRTL